MNSKILTEIMPKIFQMSCDKSYAFLRQLLVSVTNKKKTDKHWERHSFGSTGDYARTLSN